MCMCLDICEKGVRLTWVSVKMCLRIHEKGLGGCPCWRVVC